MDTFTFNVLNPPTVNHYWLRNKNGRLRLSDRALLFRNELFKQFAKCQNLGADDLPRMHITDPVFVVIDYWPPDRRKRDLDNIIKPILDAIEHTGIIVNDSQVKHLVATKHDFTPLKLGVVHITLEVITLPNKYEEKI